MSSLGPPLSKQHSVGIPSNTCHAKLLMPPASCYIPQEAVPHSRLPMPCPSQTHAQLPTLLQHAKTKMLILSGRNIHHSLTLHRQQVEMPACAKQRAACPNATSAVSLKRWLERRSIRSNERGETAHSKQHSGSLAQTQ
jgi:hypothetical protein